MKLSDFDFDLPEGQPAEGATELHQLYVAAEAKGTGVAAALILVKVDFVLGLAVVVPFFAVYMAGTAVALIALGRFSVMQVLTALD